MRTVRPAVSSVVRGAKLTALDVTANRGDARAAGSVTAFYLSVDARRSSHDVKLGKRSVPSLAAGHRSRARTELRVPRLQAAGLYYVIACADAVKRLRERHEGDNCRAATGRLDVVVPLVGPDVVTVTDSTPPAFGGATGVDQVTDSSLRAVWSPATDDFTLSDRIVYDVCWSTSPMGCSAGSFVAMATTAAGATSYIAGGLSPATTYYFVVRARDYVGNEDANSNAASGTTPADTTAPAFGGVTGVDQLSDSSLRASWSAAADDITPASQIAYEVCWSTLATGCSGSSFTAMATTAAGATSYTATGLSPATTYSFVVRARDAAGNTDGGSVVASGTTAADTTAPVFAGATGVSQPTDTSLRASWSAATDDASPASQIVYRVCWSTSPTGCSGGSFVAMATTTAGATSYTATGLSPSTTYHFVVRARDASGNDDANDVVKSAATAADTIAPVFGGATGVDSPTFSSLRVVWSAASDDVTPASQIVYQVCWSTSPTGCTSGAFVAMATTAAGATSYTATSLSGSTTYYFVVRARDAAGNSEGNNVVRSGTTLAG